MPIVHRVQFDGALTSLIAELAGLPLASISIVRSYATHLLFGLSQSHELTTTQEYAFATCRSRKATAPLMQDGVGLTEMDPMDLMQSFVERCERSAPASELQSAFQSALEQMGFRYFACCSHVNPGDPPQGAVVVHNYPTAWACSYIERNLHELDPVFLRAERTILPFFWDAPDFRASLSAPQRRMMQEAADAGIVHGYTMPIHTPWIAGSYRASCSVVPDSGTISAHAYCAMQVMSMYLYDSVRHRNEVAMAQDVSARVDGALSSRERQCLELVARGKSDWDISRLVCISQHTVHKHIEAAKRKLGVSTRVQAVVWAVQRGEISLGDVMRADPLRKDAAEGSSGGSGEEQLSGLPRGERTIY